jgi:hypothetical protein
MSRGLRVMIDADLADLYGVPTKALNQAVKLNAARFPADFVFRLEPTEKAELVTNCDHLSKLKFSKSLPYAFTEHGAIQAANLNADLAQRLAELEERTGRLELSHDTFSRNTRNQLRQVFEAIRELTMPPDPPARPIGFLAQETKKNAKSDGSIKGCRVLNGELTREA